MKKISKILKLTICIGLLSAFIGCTATANHESTGQYIDNSVITTKVKTAIFSDESLKVTQINVESYKGVVQLSGFVDSSENAIKAETIARNIEGVISVENSLVVK